MNIKINSKEIKPGDTFVAIKGVNHDGHDYINEAIMKGAVRIVAEHGEYKVPTLIVEDTYDYLIKYLKNNYYEKISKLKLIGITGTNGKTTSCYHLYQVLNKLGIKTAYIGTIGFYMEEKVNDLNNTTPSIVDLYEMLLICSKKNYKFVVMEVSSHALAMRRCETLLFDYAVFTNLTLDHLDYHKTMDNYKNAKLKLFQKIKQNGASIINIDDSYSKYFLIKKNNVVTFGRLPSKYQITVIKSTIKESNFKVLNNNREYNYKTKLVGIYNIYNIMPSIIIANDLNFRYRDIKNVIKNISAPPGRFEVIEYKDNSIIIDYAHTPDGVLNVLKNVNKMSKGCIYTIIGCGGDREWTKRSKMANIATNLSTLAIFTSDNPRSERIDDIINDMTKGLENTNYIIEPDRKNAIKKGIQKLNKDDILLVLGKGHEKYQIIGNVKYPFDDKEVVLDFIRR